MKKLEFKAEDFRETYKSIWDNSLLTLKRNPQQIAEIAQAIFDEWLKGATVVYASKQQYWQWSEEINNLDTHKALLICIEPIKQKCEKHNVVVDFEAFCFTCETCGVEIEPTGWKEKE